MRLVKQTVNQDDPTVYHLFYGDEDGSPGFDLTFFEYPGAAAGKAGDGMVHQVGFRVGTAAALDFWRERLNQAGIESVRGEGTLDFRDPEGLVLRIHLVETDEAPLVARHPEVPEDVAIQGFHGVRAYAAQPSGSREFLLGALDFIPGEGDAFTCRGDERSSYYAYDPAPGPGRSGPGTVHHVAWASRMDDQLAWRDRVIAAGGHPTPVIDRFYFRSVYFREPSGVLFEIATIGPGFGADEDPAHLGERLSLPPAFERLRPQLERVLTPLPNPRQAARQRAGT
jgi:glyoxalase family protein